ncbi:MAG: VOC family protein [bacterium]
MKMMGQIASVSVYVSDLEQALRFYVDQLEFEPRSAAFPGPDARSVVVAPPGGQTELVLTTLPVAGTQRARTGPKIGSFTGLVFSTEDIGKTYEDLSHRGVKFAQPPKEEGWGTWVQFEDPDGNTLVAMQPAPAPMVVRSTRF